MADMYGGGIKLPQAILDAQKTIDPTIASETSLVIEREATNTGRKIWEAPILDRSKLRDHLNTLEQSHYSIFQILPLDRTSVQVVCFSILPEPEPNKE